MKTRVVEVCPYDSSWEYEFNKIREEIVAVLGEYQLRVEHVGSTSVKGLCAKPIIDIDVVIEDYTVFDEVKKRLSSIGYIHVGDLGIVGREAFKYDNKPHLMTHHLYVCPKDSPELNRHIVFRDFLRNNKEWADEYGRVKIEGAKLYPLCIDSYIEHKSAIISEIYSLCGLIANI